MARRTTTIFFLAWSCCIPAPTFSQESNPSPEAGAATSHALCIRELQSLLRQSRLLELRSTFNGSYGAGLLLDSQTLTYYTASFHHKRFFRVYKNRSERNAEHHYRQLSNWSHARSKEEIAGMKAAARQAQNVLANDAPLNAPDAAKR